MHEQTKATYDVREAARVLGISLSGLYREVKDGRLVARKLGGRTLILGSDLFSYLENLPVKTGISGAHSARMKKQWRARRAAEAQAR